MEKCLFCEIIEKKQAFFVHENELIAAFLDINPRSKGMCLVVPKKHYESFDEDLYLTLKSFETSILIAKKLKKALNPNFVIFSILPSETKHFCIRLYPVYQELPIIEGNPLKTTQEELKEICEKIKEVEIEKEKKMTKEEIEWIRRYMERA